MRFDELSVGQQADVVHTVTLADIDTFMDLTGDRNPLHDDADFAASTRFGGIIAHGMLSASFVSTVLGMKLPGTNAVYVSQALRFKRPVKPGDTITVTAKVTALVPERKRVQLTTVITNQDRKVVIEGEAEMMMMA